MTKQFTPRQPSDWRARNLAFGAFLDQHYPLWREWTDTTLMSKLEVAFNSGWTARSRRRK